MKLLLDTHCWLWAISAPEKLNAKMRKRIENSNTDVFLSSASLWEAAIKQKLGKIKLPFALDDYAAHQAQEERFLELPIAFRHAGKVAELPQHHRDPFDRMLVAQAICEDLILVTADRQVMRYPGKIEWAGHDER